MSDSDEAGADQPSDTAIAEAANWVARLRSDQRTAETETRFRAWLALTAENVTAFETVTDAWDLAAGVLPKNITPPRAERRFAPALASVAALAALLFFLWPDSGTAFRTGVGERRVVSLADGTRMLLNTDTRLKVRFSAERRSIILDQGEVSFEVAHDATRPFVVAAGNSQVVAIGTHFDVRWTERDLAVTLSEGRVKVIDRAPRGRAHEFDLRPGQRLENRDAAVPVLRNVNLEVAEAWRSGQVVFDALPLPQAVAEMNRYSRDRIEIRGLGADRVKVSGVFRAGASAKFARAIGDLYSLKVTQDVGHIVIEPGPEPHAPTAVEVR